MKGDVTAKILEILSNSISSVGDLIDVFLSSGYGASHSRMEYNLRARKRKRDARLFDRLERQRYYNLVYKLKRDGLIQEVSAGGRKILKITARGRDKLNFFKKKRKSALPDINYKKVNNDKFVIVMFDVPEKERRKRDWLREALKNLGLRMVQKSVWIGKVKIPKELLDDLFKLRLVDYIEVFEINKSGSLRQLV